MYGISELKPSFSMTTQEIECPIRGCDVLVPRRTRTDGPLGNGKFLCRSHRIHISPSTFAYENPADAFLWGNDHDTELLEQICGHKTESNRLTQERSEDALTWNVFRYFERQKQTSSLRHHLQPASSGVSTETIYWSYSAPQRNTWDLLSRAHHEFGELLASTTHPSKPRTTEPDIILLTDTDLILIEAKFTSSNRTSGNRAEVEKRVSNPKKYVTGGDDWFSEVFSRDATYEGIVRDQKYELLRMWLLGSWMAAQLGVRFTLVNLVREGSEESIAESFGRYLTTSDSRHFVRQSWEGIARKCLPESKSDEEASRLLRYFREKTAGFVEKKATEVAEPVKAFSL
jgi:hypothetical protein